MKNVFFSTIFLVTCLAYSQEKKPKDSIASQTLDEVLIQAIRVQSNDPITHSNLTKKEIATRNLGQDIPILMNYMPNVVSTSDAGAGVGYTGIRVRGSDATRVNITINGIPYNDSESMGTYWVDLPDFSSSVESLQLQRGVGTSTNGAGAFGASLNILTDAISEKATGEFSNSFGSFNTRKHTLKFSTGKLNKHIEIAGRISVIKSDGYVDRAFSNLKSYFLQTAYVDDKTLIKAIAFGGFEETYQSWYGVDAETLETNRTFNFYTYDNQVDHYNQDHYQLHWNQKYNNNWNSTLAFHYTWGRGYYEQYKEDQDFEDYGFSDIIIGDEIINTTNLIRRKWLDNDFYGTTFSLQYKNNTNFNINLGGAYNIYNGDHFGEVIWAQYASDSEIRDHYYDYYGDKTEFNLFTKAQYKITKKLNTYLDLQVRNINYKATGEFANVDDTFTFFNPKAGLNFSLNKNNNFYLSYALANREPNRTDYENGNPKPETLHDFELGWRLKTNKTSLNSNIYYMKYKDQLVLTGALNDVGAPIRANVGDSYRLGLELDGQIQLSKKINLQANIAVSTNKNNNYITSYNGEIVNLGNTNIAFSPNFVAGSILNYQPIKHLDINFLSKYVGDQYMANIDRKNSKLDAYFVSDFNVNYKIVFKKILNSIELKLLVNNLFNTKYVSNGYYYTYDDTWSNPGETITLDGAGYYPQATTNFLVGATINF